MLYLVLRYMCTVLLSSLSACATAASDSMLAQQCINLQTGSIFPTPSLVASRDLKSDGEIPDDGQFVAMPDPRPIALENRQLMPYTCSSEKGVYWRSSSPSGFDQLTTTLILPTKPNIGRYVDAQGNMQKDALYAYVGGRSLVGSELDTGFMYDTRYPINGKIGWKLFMSIRDEATKTQQFFVYQRDNQSVLFDGRYPIQVSLQAIGNNQLDLKITELKSGARPIQVSTSLCGFATGSNNQILKRVVSIAQNLPNAKLHSGAYVSVQWKSSTLRKNSTSKPFIVPWNTTRPNNSAVCLSPNNNHTVKQIGDVVTINNW